MLPRRIGWYVVKPKVGQPFEHGMTCILCLPLKTHEKFQPWFQCMAYGRAIASQEYAWLVELFVGQSPILTEWRLMCVVQLVYTPLALHLPYTLLRFFYLYDSVKIVTNSLSSLSISLYSCNKGKYSDPDHNAVELRIYCEELNTICCTTDFCNDRDRGQKVVENLLNIEGISNSQWQLLGSC